MALGADLAGYLGFCESESRITPPSEIGRHSPPRPQIGQSAMLTVHAGRVHGRNRAILL
jgi:hypothetical protein